MDSLALRVFFVIYIAMIATSFWESYVEGRNAWGKQKEGAKLNIFGFELTSYHFFLFFVMYPVLLSLPFVIYGWDKRLFGIVASAYVTGLVVEDLFWYIVNPKVRFMEFFTSFSDYYPWIKIGKQKILPVFYAVASLVGIFFWFHFWRS